MKNIKLIKNNIKMRGDIDIIIIKKKKESKNIKKEKISIFKL